MPRRPPTGASFVAPVKCPRVPRARQHPAICNRPGVRIALMIEGQEDVTWDDWRALATACEEHGVEGLFRSDHYLSVFGVSGRGSLDAWATINALAAITTKLRLGTLVSPATFRHGSELSKV